MKISASQLRSDIYRILDQVLDSGVTVRIERRGRIITISPDDRPSRLSRLKKRKCIKGNPKDLIHLDWSDEWNER